MPAAVWGPLSNEKTREVGAHAPVSVFCGHQARYSCSDNGDGTHLRRQHLHSEQGDTRRSSCENTKRLNTVIATLPTAALQSKVQTLQSQRKHSASARSAIKTGEELKEVRALLKVSACRPRLVVAQSMNGRSGHGTWTRSLGLGGHRLGAGTAREYSVFHHVIRVAKEKVDIGYSSVSPTALPV